MTTVKVKKKTDAPLFKASINGSNLSFSDNVATKDLADGEHALQWFVQGDPGDEYTISITSPASAAFSHTDKLDSTRRDAGHKWFKIGDAQ